LESIAEEVFDSHGFASLRGAYESLDYSFLHIDGLKNPLRPAEDAEIIYDVVHDYLSKKESLEDSWWDEYRTAQDRFEETIHLVITERPVAIPVFRQCPQSTRISYFVDTKHRWNIFVAVFADVSGVSSAIDKAQVLNHAKKELSRIGSELQGALCLRTHQ
jgi:hypothetical protein